MLHFALFSMIVGALFGLRFRLFVLLPFTVVGGLATALVAALSGAPGLAVLTSTAIFWAGLQIGYLFGSLARFTIAAARLGRGASVWAPAKIAR